MDQLSFIQDLAVVLVTAGAVAWLCQRIGVPLVVGYLLAGIVIGPYTPPFALVASLENVHTLANLGLVFVMFFVGLNLSLPRLRRLGAAPVVATALSALLLINLCRLVGPLIGLSGVQSLFLAGVVVVSSSAIISKVLAESDATLQPHGQMALSVTVLEDCVAVAMLALLGSYTASAAAPAVWQVVARMGAFVLVTVVVMLLLLPRLLGRLRSSAAPEIRWIVVAGIVLAAAWLAASAGFSVALGAFLLGSTIGGTTFRPRLEQAFEGLRDLFGAVFFVSMGMLFDLRLAAEALPQALALTAFALAGRFLATSTSLMATGEPARTSVLAGLSLLPLGELSFVIAQLGVSAGIMPASFFPAVIGAALLTTVLSPLLSRFAGPPLARRLEQREPQMVRAWRELLERITESAQRARRASPAWRLIAGRLVQVGLEIAVLLSAVALSSALYRQVEAWLGKDLFFANGLPVIFWSAFGLLLLVPLLAIWRNLGALGMMLGEAIATGQRMLQSSLEMAVQAGGSLVVLLLAMTFLPAAQPAVVLLVLAAMGLAALLLRKPLVRWYSRAQQELREQMAGEGAQSSGPAPFPAARGEWRLRVHEHSLSDLSPAIGLTIAETELRRRFGCAIAAVDRQGFAIPSPAAGMRLFPNDKLLLVGTEEQIENAEGWLNTAERRPPEGGGFGSFVTESVEVPGGFAQADKTLGELEIARRFGIQVLGLEREGTVSQNPSGEQTLRPGDRLLILGQPAQNAAFGAYLESAEPVVSEEQTTSR